MARRPRRAGPPRRRLTGEALDHRFASKDGRVTAARGHDAAYVLGWPDGVGEYPMLRRISGRWRIAHERTSTPFQMNGSARAATDLAP